tara:strand:- start:318 stop:542 length:225 start_codon:yes stop_codon:yes gene_type:complete
MHQRGRQDIRSLMQDKEKRDKMSQELPDARLHQLISFIKSGIRIIGYAFLPFDIVGAAMILFASEVIGIVEELV